MKVLLLCMFMLLGTSFAAEADDKIKWRGDNMEWKAPTAPTPYPQIEVPQEGILQSEDKRLLESVTKPVQGFWNWFYHESIVGKILQSFLGMLHAFLGMLTQLFGGLAFLFQWWWVILILLIWKAPQVLKGIGKGMLAFAKGLGQGLTLFSGRRFW